MKKGLILIMLLLMGRGVFSQHVVVITIDGFRPDFYLDSSWNTVQLRELMKKGTYAKGVNSVFPSMTYPSHTTIVTGVWPAKHGIYYNNMYEPAGASYWNNSSIKVPTIWSAAKEKGLKVASLLWPVSADAPVMYDIPDTGGMPDSIRDQFSKPATFIADLKKEVFDNASAIDYGKDHNIAKIAAYVIKKDQPDLMTIHFFSVDHYEHQEGRQGPLVKAAVADADSSVGIIIKALKDAGIWEKTVLIVTGDHGFLDVTKSVQPNVWLAKAGISGAQFFSVSGSTYLYLKDPKTLAPVKDMLAHLSVEEKKLFRIIDRKQLDAIGANPEVALALSGENGASFGNKTTGDAVSAGHGGSHGYFPDFQQIRTGFVAYGPGIKQGGVIPEMNLRDITPVITKVLGLSLPGIDGKIPAGLLTK